LILVGFDSFGFCYLVAFTILLFGLMTNKDNFAAFVTVYSQLLGFLLLEAFKFKSLYTGNHSG
jgi:hypothetical protein